jgi:hypothetical protein
LGRFGLGCLTRARGIGRLRLEKSGIGAVGLSLLRAESQFEIFTRSARLLFRIFGLIIVRMKIKSGPAFAELRC